MNRKIKVKSNIANKRIDIVLGTIFPEITRSAAKKIVMKGFVKLNGNKSRPSVKLKENDEIDIDENQIRKFLEESNSEIIPQNQNLEIIYEDENSLVINKPYGIPVHPSYKHKDNTLLNGVLYYIIHNSENPFVKVRPVHRLDKDTSGVIIFSKNLEAHQYYSRIFKKREIKKTYFALVEGNFEKYFKENDKEFIRIENYLSKKPKEIKYQSVDENDGDFAQTDIYFEKFNKENNESILRVEPKTGRTHQIRVHLSELGFPIIGDIIYGGKENERLMLHAAKLELKNYSDKNDIEFEATTKFNI